MIVGPLVQNVEWADTGAHFRKSFPDLSGKSVDEDTVPNM